MLHGANTGCDWFARVSYDLLWSGKGDCHCQFHITTVDEITIKLSHRKLKINNDSDLAC